MKSFLKMTWTEAKLFVREPVGVFFTLAFPVIMLFIFGTIYGNNPLPTSGSLGAVDMLIPAFSAMVIGMIGMMPITITLATYRENGILRRLGTTPVRPVVILLAQVVVYLVMTTLGMVLLFAFGRLVYHIHYNGNILVMLGGFLFSCLSFFGIGFILGGTLPNARVAQVVSMVLLYPMLILSGAGWPRELMPATMQKISAFIPLTYVVNLLRGLWMGEPWNLHLTETAVLAVLLGVSTGIAVRVFRWD